MSVCDQLEMNPLTSVSARRIEWSKGKYECVLIVILVILGFSLCFLLLDTHVLVHFNDEDRSGIVPIKRLKQKDELKFGEL